MAILTSTEAKDILRLEAGGTYPVLSIVLPAIDDYLHQATGHDWAADTSIDPVAKGAAMMLLVQWYENPAMIGSIDNMQYGISNVIEMLTARSLPYTPS